MRALNWILAIIAIILVGLAFALNLNPGWLAGLLDEKKIPGTLQVLTAFLTALTAAVLTALFARINEWYKAKLNLEVTSAIEHLKNKLTDKSNEILEDMKKNNADSLSKSSATFQADLDKISEAFKLKLLQITTRKYDGYADLWSSARGYYAALRKYEMNVYDEDALKVAKANCEHALGRALLVDDEDEDIFYSYFQEAVNMHDKGFDRKGTPHGLRALWNADGRKIGDLLNALKKKFSSKLLS